MTMEDHGGNIYRISEELGVPEQGLIDFSASINPLGVSVRVKDAIKDELDNMVNYPDPDTRALRQKIAAHHGIDPGNILCGNGSTELIYLVAGAFAPEKALITAPAFSEYGRAVARAGRSKQAGGVEELYLRREENFSVRVDEFIDAMQGADMAFLCNPNNPAGSLLRRDKVLEIAEAAREGECLLIIDEAFIDFSPGASVVDAVRNNPYLAVLRSMTKFYALAGLRIGYGIFHKDIVKTIKEYKEPWTVNNLAQKAAIAALDDGPYADATFRLIETEKAYMAKGLQLAGIEFFPSAANYYLLKTGKAAEIIKDLRKIGILVRDCSNFKGLDGSYIRVAVKSHRDNEMLLKELSRL